MDKKLQALSLLRDCEAGIRGLIEEAVAERDYRQLGPLAAYASAVALISVDHAPHGGLLNADTQSPAEWSGKVRLGLPSPPAVALPEQETSPLVVSNAASYPMFVRAVDRLIKIGWSKKDKAVYEHRASAQAVTAVFLKLAAAARKRGYIKPEDLLPVALEDGSDVPSYQVYLVLAWLRSLEVLVRHGNDGYKILRKPLNEAEFKKLWEMTTTRN